MKVLLTTLLVSWMFIGCQATYAEATKGRVADPITPSNPAGSIEVDTETTAPALNKWRPDFTEEGKGDMPEWRFKESDEDPQSAV